MDVTCTKERNDEEYKVLPKKVRDKDRNIHYIDKRKEGLIFCKSYQSYVKKEYCLDCNRYFPVNFSKRIFLQVIKKLSRKMNLDKWM